MEKAAHQIRYRLAQIDLLNAYQVFFCAVNSKTDIFFLLIQIDFTDLIKNLIKNKSTKCETTLHLLASLALLILKVVRENRRCSF